MMDAPRNTAPNVREADFFFDRDFAGFEGHFPGDPMLPGIAQIMAVVLTARPREDAKLLRIGRTKFMSMVRPGDTMRVRATLTENETEITVAGDCSTKGGPCAQIKLVLER